MQEGAVSEKPDRVGSALLFLFGGSTLVASLAWLDAKFAVGSIVLLGVVVMAMAVLLAALPRIGRWLVPLLTAGVIGFQVVSIVSTRVLWLSVHGVALLYASSAIFVLPRIWLGRKGGKRWAFVGAVPTALSLVSMVLAGAFLTHEVERHHASLVSLRNRVSGQIADDMTIPPGAEVLASKLQQSETSSAKARLFSNELGLRTAPCVPLHKPLAAWRKSTPRTGAQLASLLLDGLDQCPHAGVDVDALCYMLTLILEQPSNGRGS
jgi:hypothetical protein